MRKRNRRVAIPEYLMRQIEEVAFNIEEPVYCTLGRILDTAFYRLSRGETITGLGFLRDKRGNKPRALGE